MILHGKFLVKSGNETAPDNDDMKASRILLSDVSLSFWGGIDPETGIVIDASHPLFGKNVSGTILCLPSGRGSCTASQVLLELILRGKAPRAIVMRDVDGLACVGAIVAQEVFQSMVPDILHIGTQSFQQLLESDPKYGFVLQNGDFLTGNDNSFLQNDIKNSSDVALAVATERLFTQQEKKLLECSTTEAERIALRVIFRYAHITSDSPFYLEASKAHIDGCTYIGPGGLKFVERLVETGGKVCIPTTLNSVSTDRRRHQKLGVPSDYATASIALGDAYLALGCQESFTCAPYLLSNPPEKGEDIAWGESNAVVYANSVLGARTEKYADYLDICCAITGKIPAVGVHLEDNRNPQIVLDATQLLSDLLPKSAENHIQALFPTLGHLCGTLSDGKVPILLGFDNKEWRAIVTEDHLKMFCAAFGTTGTSPLIHIAGITPEANDPNAVKAILDKCNQNRIVSMSQLEETFNTLDANTNDDKVHLIALGNPHLSVKDCDNLVELVRNIAKESIENGDPKKHEDVRIMACMSRELHSKAEEQGHIDFLKNFGVEFINDTCWCMLLDPPVIPVDTDGTILTNSGKYAHYGPGLTNRKFRFGSTTDCVRAAFTGEYPKKNNMVGFTMRDWLTGSTRTINTNQKRSFVSISSLGAVFAPALRSVSVNDHTSKKFNIPFNGRILSVLRKIR